jgi:hypothetical protein
MQNEAYTIAIAKNFALDNKRSTVEFTVYTTQKRNNINTHLSLLEVSAARDTP